MVVAEHLPDPEAVANHYDELDRFYRDIWGEHVHHGYWREGTESPQQAVLELVHFMAEQLRLRVDDEICDVGCGYGASAELMAACHGVRATGVTISQRQFDRAVERIGPSSGVEIRHMDWLENDFTAARFDAVYAIESTEHMNDRQRFFDEAFRTLRPGGRLAVYAWLARPAPRRWERKHLLEPICREGRLAGMGSAQEYRELAERAGFVWEACHNLSKQVAKTWHICARRLVARTFSDPAYIRYVFDSTMRERIFALTVFRILAAYRTGAMQYALIIAQKP